MIAVLVYVTCKYMLSVCWAWIIVYKAYKAIKYEKQQKYEQANYNMLWAVLAILMLVITEKW